METMLDRDFDDGTADAVIAEFMEWRWTHFGES
jgi:hypothetical protein